MLIEWKMRRKARLPILGCAGMPIITLANARALIYHEYGFVSLTAGPAGTAASPFAKRISEALSRIARLNARNLMRAAGGRPQMSRVEKSEGPGLKPAGGSATGGSCRPAGGD